MAFDRQWSTTQKTDACIFPVLDHPLELVVFPSRGFNCSTVVHRMMCRDVTPIAAHANGPELRQDFGERVHVKCSFVSFCSPICVHNTVLVCFTIVCSALPYSGVGFQKLRRRGARVLCFLGFR